MAEVSGLTIGVVALVGVFKDCLDLLSYISASRSFGRDSLLMIAKLDIEKTLLLQWGSRVGLFGNKSNVYLEDPQIRATVYESLVCIKLLLNDSGSMQRKYGLRPAAIEDSILGQVSLSSARLQEFSSEYALFQSRMAAHQTKTGGISKIKWSIWDREKFEKLITDLSYFIAKLRDLVPVSDVDWNSMAREDLARVSSDSRGLMLVREAINLKDHPLKSAIDTRLAEDRIIDIIWFRKMRDRQDDVVDAHESTFDWVYGSPGVDGMWDSLAEWLRSATGLYWISGKAGSGKSTLMKFLYVNQRTRSLLKEWSKNTSLTTAAFFFWQLGTPEQKSQQGLMRALLYHILKANRSMISTLLPGMWREAQGLQGDHVSQPSTTELKTALKRFSEIVDPSKRFCFFIDGLDEYDGNVAEGIAFLETLSASHYIKVVVSSRQTAQCFDAFSEKPMLQLHKLTQKDIEVYVKSTIGMQKSMKTLLLANPIQAPKIIDEIVSKASGVFLWVVLACRSLVDGLASSDSIMELYRRIDELPPELNELFEFMLRKIEPRYRQQAAQMLRICVEAQVKQENRPLPTIALVAATQDDLNFTEASAEATIGDMALLQKRNLCETLEGRLRSRCWGLLEIRQLTNEQSLHENECVCFHIPHDKLVDSRVHFLHRTVLEFLMQPKIWDADCLYIPDQTFDACSSLASAYLLLLKMAYCPDPRTDKQYWDRIEVCLKYVSDVFFFSRNANACASEASIRTIFEADRILGLLHKQLKGLRIRHGGVARNSVEDFSQFPFFPLWNQQHHLLILSAQTGLLVFIQHELLVNKEQTISLLGTLLFHAVTQQHVPSEWSTPVSIEMIKFLLSKGADPNQSCKMYAQVSASPWQAYLPLFRCTRLQNAEAAFEILKLFLEHDADPDANAWQLKTPVTTRSTSAEDLISFHFIQDPMRMRQEGWKTILTMGDDLIQILHEKRRVVHTMAPFRGLNIS